jgi:hypothetical protein
MILIETRKEEGEDHLAVAGFFRHDELYDVVGDECDLMGFAHRLPCAAAALMLALPPEPCFPLRHVAPAKHDRGGVPARSRCIGAGRSRRTRGGRLRGDPCAKFRL